MSAESDTIAADVERRDHARSRVLAALQSGPVDSSALNAICYRYGARIMELRRAGWPIAARREGKVLWRYELTGAKGEKVKPEAKEGRTCPHCGARLEDTPKGED